MSTKRPGGSVTITPVVGGTALEGQPRAELLAPPTIAELHRRDVEAQQHAAANSQAGRDLAEHRHDKNRDAKALVIDHRRTV